MFGGEGDNTLAGNCGNDLLVGDDFLDGVLEADTYEGVGDRYQLFQDPISEIGDTILGFENDIDTLVLPAEVAFEQLDLREVEAGVSVLLGNRQIALIFNIQSALIDRNNFAIA